MWTIGKMVEWLTPPERPEFPEMKIPLVEEGAPIALCYGRSRLDAPFLIWWGGVFFDDISSHAPLDMFISLQLGLGIGIDNFNLFRIGAGDVEIWSGDALGNDFNSEDGSYDIAGPIGGEDPISLGDVFGEGPEYGIFQSGKISNLNAYMNDHGIRWYPGNFTQTKSEYLDTTQPLMTAYRGQSYVMFLLPIIGFGPGLPPFNFDCGGFPEALDPGGATNIINGNEANPAEVIYDILTQEWGRAGLDTALINTASFTAAAVTLHGEGVGSGMAGNITRATTALDVIRDILFQIDAIMYFNPFTGEVVLKLIREDYSIPGLPSFDQDDLSAEGVISFQQTMYNDLVNTVRMKFKDRESNYQNKTAIVHNMAVFYGTDERINARDFTLPFCKDSEAAMEIATRELKLLSQPLRTAELSFNRSAFDLLPGDVFKWSHSDYNLTDVVMRVAKVDFGDRNDGRVKISCAEDRFALAENLYDPPSPMPTEFPPSPSEATVKFTIEVPQWLGFQGEVEGVMADRDHVRLFYLAERPDAATIGFRPEVSENAGVTYLVDGTAIRRFGQTALIETAYDRTNEPYDTGTGLRIDNVSDILGSLQTRSVANIRNGSNLILVVTAGGNQEFIAYESATALAEDAAAEVWQVDDTPTDNAFVDETADFNDATSANFNPFPASAAVGDYCAVGFATKPLHLVFDNAGGTAGVGGAGVWEYWNR